MIFAISEEWQKFNAKRVEARVTHMAIPYYHDRVRAIESMANMFKYSFPDSVHEITLDYENGEETVHVEAGDYAYSVDITGMDNQQAIIELLNELPVNEFYLEEV